VRVTVTWATLVVQDSVDLDLHAGATVADAVEASGLVARHGIDRARLGFAIHGHRVTHDRVLADGDRVDLTRPLEVDPKAARIARVRARQPAKRPRRAAQARSK